MKGEEIVRSLDVPMCPACSKEMDLVEIVPNDNNADWKCSRCGIIQPYLIVPAKNPSPWISVKDRLPEARPNYDTNSESVIARTKVGWLSIATYRKRSDTWREDATLNQLSITHWMPIPKPPELQQCGICYEQCKGHDSESPTEDT